jgi:hypothetical protein
MHGITHVPGGPDPIPGLGGSTAAPFFDQMMTLVATYSLRGYWRLGDGGLGPYADSKPASSLANVPMDRVNNTVDMTDITPGALPAAQDDGAVQFNSSTGLTSDDLQGTNTWGTIGSNPFEIGPAGELTVMGWVKPAASASTFDGGIFSMLANTGSYVGYVLGVQWPARTVFYQAATTAHRLSGPILTADEWVFAAAVRDATSERIYLNGALVATGTLYNPQTGTNMQPRIGRFSEAVDGTLYGAVDEVSVWADGTFTVTLPTAVGNLGAEVTVKNTSGAGTITVGRTSSQTIDGAASNVTLTTLQARTFVSDGAGWWQTGTYP